MLPKSLKGQAIATVANAKVGLSYQKTDWLLKVAAVGLLKSGKSTFLSAMTQHQERFKSGVIRTTLVNQKYTDAYFTWIDTPGVDDTGPELTEALSGARQADVVLFVHNLRQGELDQNEMNFILQCITQEKEFLKKLNFVLTHADELDAQSANVIKQAIIQQCKTRLNHVPQLIVVSAQRYLKGMAEGKNMLIQASNIVQVQERLIHLYKVGCVAYIKDQCRDFQNRLKLDMESVNARIEDLHQNLPS